MSLSLLKFVFSLSHLNKFILVYLWKQINKATHTYLVGMWTKLNNSREKWQQQQILSKFCKNQPWGYLWADLARSGTIMTGNYKHLVKGHEPMLYGMLNGCGSSLKFYKCKLERTLINYQTNIKFIIIKSWKVLDLRIFLFRIVTGLNPRFYGLIQTFI